MSNKYTKTIIAGYFPVIHQGYINFFTKYKNADALYVLGEDILKTEDSLRKDIRSLTPSQAAKLIEALKFFPSVKVIDRKLFERVIKTYRLIMPDDDLSHKLVDNTSQSSLNVEFYPVFLRWDRRSVSNLNEEIQNATITNSKLHSKFIKLAQEESTKSSDFWRRVGAILKLENSSIYLAHNSSKPTEYTVWVDGDPRNVFSRGVNIDDSLFLHAEAALISNAAREGLCTKGSIMYVTTFPCPTCSMIIANSGVSELYYRDGYATLNGRDNLTNAGIKIIKVLGSEPPLDDRIAVKYN